MSDCTDKQAEVENLYAWTSKFKLLKYISHLHLRVLVFRQNLKFFDQEQLY